MDDDGNKVIMTKKDNSCEKRDNDNEIIIIKRQW